MNMSESDHHLVRNSNDYGSSTTLSYEEHYLTVVQGPLPIETETIPVAESQCLMSGKQSVPIQPTFMAEQQSIMQEQHFSMSGQIIGECSARATLSSSLTYPIQATSDVFDPRLDRLSTCSSVSVTADVISCEDEELKQIVIHPHEYKEEFKEDLFDIVLIYSESNRDEALTFREILIKFVNLLDGKPPSICVLDQNAHLNYISSRFDHMEEALRRSTYMFLFLTKDFCGDNWAQLQRDECLMESIHNAEKKWCVVPILTKSRKEADYQLPFGLRALKGVEISHMLRGKTLDSVDVNALGPKDVDPFFLKNMTKMLNDRIYLKFEREKQQLVSLQNWLKEEKHRRWMLLQKKKLDNELQDRTHVMEKLGLLKELDRKMQEIKAIDVEAAGKKDAECIRQLRTTEKTIFLEGLQHNRIPEAEPIGQKAATKAPATVVYHQNYYGTVVHMSPAEQTVYNIHGSNVQIGNENVQHSEKVDSKHVLLDETNLETDAPESLEYIVVTEEEEEAFTSLQQDADLETTSVNGSRSVSAEWDDTLEALAEQKPTVALSSDADLALALSSSLKSMHPENEMSTEEDRSPEDDRPQFLPALKGQQNVLSHRWHTHGNDLPSGKSFTTTGSSKAIPLSSETNLVDASNSVQGFATPQGILSDQSLQPTAAVTPICQKLLPEHSDDDLEEEVRLKLPWSEKEEEEETKLKSPYLGKSAKSTNGQTNVTHTGLDCNNRETIGNAKYQATVADAGQENSFKVVLDSAKACTSSMMLKTRVEKEMHVVYEVPGSSHTEEESRPEGTVELAAGLAESSSVDPMCSQGQNFVMIQTDDNHGSTSLTPRIKVTASHPRENKSTCTAS